MICNKSIQAHKTADVLNLDTLVLHPVCKCHRATVTSTCKLHLYSPEIVHGSLLQENIMTVNATKIVIVGGGNLANGLSNMFTLYNAGDKYTFSVYEPVESNIPLISGSSHHSMDGSFRGYKGIDVDAKSSSLSVADIIFLAIPSSAIRSFVENHTSLLKGKILVDCSNPTASGDDLRTVVESMGIENEFRWIKGFNDNGAIELINQKVASNKIPTTKLCGKDEAAVGEVKKLAESSMGFTVKVVPFSQFDAISRHQNDLGKTWIHATVIMMLIFTFAMIYSIVRDHMTEFYGSTLPWQYLPCYTTNHVMAWTCIWGFALSQLPGVIARFCIMFGRYQLPELLLWGLNIRKELGVISLFFLLCHAIMSLTIWNAGYFYWSYDDPTNVEAKYLWHVETAMFFGIVGFALYVVMGICSIPSVADAMNSRQWQFVYGVVAWTALIFGLCHNLFIGKNIMQMINFWPNTIPHATVMSCTIPIGVIGLKVIQVLLSPFNFRGKTKIAKGDGDDHNNEAEA